MTDEDLYTIISIKNRLGYDSWINLLFIFNGSEDSIKDFSLSEKEIEVIKKLYNSRFKLNPYLYIDYTDIGKSMAFEFLASNESNDRITYLSPFTAISDKTYGQGVVYNNLYIFIDNNNLTFYGYKPLDEDIEINGTLLRKCVYDHRIGGIINSDTCSKIFAVSLIYNESLLNISGIKYNINVDILTDVEKIKDAYVFIYNPIDNKIYQLRLKYLYYLGILKEFENSSYEGLLYILPSILKIIKGDLTGYIDRAYLSSPKEVNYLWIRLYFLNENNDYFTLVYYNTLKYGLQPIIYSDYPVYKIWKINLPENLEVPEYYYCVFLAIDLDGINKCQKLFNKPFLNSYYNV